MAISAAVDDLARRHWEASLVAAPITATMFGVHDHDDRVGDPTPAGEATRRDEVRTLLAEAEALAPTTDRDHVVVGMLRSSLADELVELGEGASGTSQRLLRCEQMAGPHQTWQRSMPNLTYPEPAHADAAVRRYEGAHAHLDGYADRFAEAVERGITPVTRNVERTLAQLEAFVGAPLADDPLIAVGGPQDWDGEDAWRDGLTAAVRDHVRPAMQSFAQRLRDEQLPRGRDDEHAGLCHVDDTGALYADTARLMTSVEVDPDAVHRLGVEYVTGPLAEEWAELGAATFGEDDPLALMDRLRAEPSLQYASSEEMIDQAEEALERSLAVMGDWFGRLPEAGCVVRPVPDYLVASSPPAYYVQPAPDGSRPGTYYVNSGDIGSMLRSEGEATAFHEAIPGHHLQLAISGELTDVPEFLKHGVQIAYAEGWGLYAERLADEMGLYSTDVDKLGMLSLDAFRAARLVVDTGLHAQGWSRGKAVEWMFRHTPLPRHTIETEVDRYIAIPGQALGYKLGQIEIRGLRETAEERLGDAFDVAAFHDTVLANGMLTLPVLRDVVHRWIASVERT